MKRILFFATIVATFVLTSCQKEESFKDKSEDALVFTATIDNAGTKTTINTDGSDETNRGKIAWVAGDEITITDAQSNSVVYVAQSSGQSTTFKEKSGQSKSLETGSTYSAVYGSAPNTTQAYGDYYSDANQAKNIYMTSGAATSSTSFTFTAACSLLKLNLEVKSTEIDKTISKIEIFGKSGGTDVIYTLNCAPAQHFDFTLKKVFYVALPAGSYSVMKFTNETGHICYKTAKSAMVIENNYIQPVTLTGIVFNDMLPGKFSVKGKQVRFSRGNLYWDGNKYHFESAQNANPTEWNTSHVGHFYWSNTNDYTTSGMEPYAESYSCGNRSTKDVFCFGEGNKDNIQVDGQSGWYTLSFDEWTDLLGRSSSSLYKCNVTVCEKTYCLILAPDGFSGTIANSYDASTWPAAEAAGLVCLPVAGTRSGSGVWDTDLGRYWSSTPNESDYEFASYLAFYQGGAGVYKENTRDGGFSVRLVR